MNTGTHLSISLFQILLLPAEEGNLFLSKITLENNCDILCKLLSALQCKELVLLEYFTMMDSCIMCEFKRERDGPGNEGINDMFQSQRTIKKKMRIVILLWFN